MAHILQFFLSLACVANFYTRDLMERQNKIASFIDVEKEQKKLAS